MVQAPVAVGEVLAGKYRVDRILGSGGMSVVVLAWHLELEQEVAIKLLHGSESEGSDAAERFRREARAAARIRSEHVSRVLDVGTLPDGSPFMVMEYLTGNDLAEELARRGPLPIEEVVLDVLQALEALAQAHAAGIVHRDLKPENLFLANRADGTRIIKVLDFGISKSIGPNTLTELSLTKTSAFVGSPLYMSPEQMRSSRSVDERTDIWSLGAILYELITGRLPFTGDSIGELCTSLLHDVPMPLSGLRPGLPPGFETVVLRCLEKDREQRYSNVAELAHALAPFAAGASVYAERAERVLALAGIRSTPLDAPAPALGATFKTLRSASGEFTRGTQLGLGDVVASERHSVPRSWVQSSAEIVARRRGPIGVALGVLLALGVGLIFGSRLRDDSADADKGGSRAPVLAETAAVAALKPAVEPADALTSLSPSLVQVAPVAPSAAAALAANDSGKSTNTLAHRRAPVRSVPVAQRPQPTSLATAPPRATVAPEPALAPPVNAWDPATFGGRH